jgi:molybdopterin-guanine dinucleotide biosynthesis protein A
VDELTGLVLAGGRSRRMGRDKALLEIDGRPLVERVAERLASVCGRVLIAAGERPLPPLPWDRVDDRVAGAGPLAGILGGLAATTTPLLAVAAVDMPDVDPDVFTTLAGRWDGRAPAVVPRRAGRLEPLHAVYATAALPRLAALFDAGERSPTRALRRVAATVVEVDDAAPWAGNLNTPADVDRHLGGGPEEVSL